MKRKLIQQGKGGFTIYLPKDWVDKKGLKAGHEVNLTESGPNIIIGSEIKESREIELEVNKDNKENLQNILTHIYRKGFNKITIKGLDRESLSTIKAVVQNILLGFEITERTQENCVLENVSEPTEQKYDKLVARLFFLIKETQNMLIEDFDEGRFDNKQEIEDVRLQYDRTSLFCRRILTKEKYERDPVIGWELLTFLMSIQHSLYYLYKFAQSKKFRSDKETTALVKELRAYFDLFEGAFTKKDIAYINKINHLKKDYQFGRCLDLLKKSKGDKTVALSYIRELFRTIQIGTSPILAGLFEKYSQEK